MPEINLDLGLYPKQLEALHTDATELLFGGMTEGGKSHFLRCALIIWCLEIENLQCTLIRKKYSDIRDNHLEGEHGFKNLLSPLVNIGKVTITQDEIRFWNGSRIYFLHCQDERQFSSAQGVERHVLAVDEATQISDKLLKFFRTWVRASSEFRERLPPQWKGKFPRIIYTANPIGPSVPFFRKEFVKARPVESIEEVHGFKRQYIPSRYTDNPSVDEAAHIGRLQGIGDVKLIEALDKGNWDALQGDFFPEWDETRHVLSDFHPPSHWARFRTFDWGTADPFVVYWVAVSDGEPFKDSIGKTRWFPRGSLIFYNEWYGCNPDKPSEGNRMRNEDIAEGIFNRSDFASRDTPILTDSLPFQDRGGKTIAQIFWEIFQGLGTRAQLVHGDTSRVSGWSLLRSRLIGSQIDSNDPTRTPMIYFCERCEAARNYIPTLCRHPSPSKSDDAQEHGEATHACDAIRLACTAHTIIKDKQVPTQARIEKELKERRPNAKNMLRTDYRRFFV